jgi:phosphoglycolate phosphatase
MTGRSTDANKAFTLDTDRVAVFDLDGTLVDSVDGIAVAINRLLRAKKALPLQREEASALLGHGLDAFAKAACESRGVTLTDDELWRFHHDYLSNPLIGTKLYPRVPATLSLLAQKGWRLAVCTNKSEAPAIAILNGLAIFDYFDVICCGDTVEQQKPHPGHLSETLQRGGFRHLPAVMIGDHAVDVAVASASGMASVFAGWGYGHTEPAFRPSAVASSFEDLPGILESLIPARSRSLA